MKDAYCFEAQQPPAARPGKKPLDYRADRVSAVSSVPQSDACEPALPEPRDDQKVPSQTVCFIVSATVAVVTAAETGMFKGRHFDRSIILLCIRWYLANNLSLRNLEEMMAERGISVDHATNHRWVVRYSPELLKRFNARKRAVTGKWHVDETYIKVRRRWMCVDAPLNARKIITYDRGTVIGC
jgi:hypothetical protein